MTTHERIEAIAQRLIDGLCYQCSEHEGEPCGDEICAQLGRDAEFLRRLAQRTELEDAAGKETQP